MDVPVVVPEEEVAKGVPLKRKKKDKKQEKKGAQEQEPVV